jgi:hypothetical protein
MQRVYGSGEGACQWHNTSLQVTTITVVGGGETVIGPEQQNRRRATVADHWENWSTLCGYYAGTQHRHITHQYTMFE